MANGDHQKQQQQQKKRKTKKTRSGHNAVVMRSWEPSPFGYIDITALAFVPQNIAGDLLGQKERVLHQVLNASVLFIY